MTSSSQAPGLPLVTVIVPCRNEARFIEPLLRCLLASSYPRERLEAIFVDAMSTDGTREALTKAARSHPFIRVLDNPRLVAPSGLNLAIKAARGEVIVRMDAHAEYPEDYIARCVRLLESHPRIGSAGGRSVNLPGADGPWARAAAFVTAHRFGVGNVAYVTSLKRGWVDTVAYGCFRRDVLRRVGLYDERLTRNQDNELHARLKKADYLIAFDPDIVSYHRNRGTLGGLMRQGFATGVWNVYTLCLAPYTWKPRRFVPAAFVAYLGALAAAAALREPWTRAAASPLLAYAALVAACSAGARDSGRLRAAATFVCYHASYGAGPFVGLWRVLSGRWREELGRPLAGGAGPAQRTRVGVEVGPAEPEELDGVLELLKLRIPAYWMRSVSDESLRAFLRHALKSPLCVLLAARAPDGANPAGYILAVRDARRFWLGFWLGHPLLASRIAALRLARLRERRRQADRRPVLDPSGQALPLFSWAPSSPRASRIVGLFVRPEHRRKGIAMELYFKLFGALEQLGAERVEEYMGPDYLDYAGKFPEVCGWKPQRCRCGGYKLSKTLGRSPA